MQYTIKILRESLSAAFDSQGSPLYDEREMRSIEALLLEEVCGIGRVDRIMHPDRELPAEMHQKMAEIAMRLQSGMPVQQALGYTRFCGARFSVSPDVLIPRPETEELVYWIKDINQRKSARICDIGTGSGCIALSLARLINKSTVLAIDLSTSALSIARENACQQGVDNVQFVQTDILKLVDNFEAEKIISQLSTLCQPIDNIDNQPQISTGCQQLTQSCPPFDIIVSNPPYICRRETAEMSDIVLKNEPDMALFVPDDDPLLFYRAIAYFALACLAPEGELFFEINAAYGPETCQLLSNLGFEQIELRQDVTGRDRMVRARRPKK